VGCKKAADLEFVVVYKLNNLLINEFVIEPVVTVGKLDDIQCIRSRVSRILKYQYRNTLFEHDGRIAWSHVQAPGVTGDFFSINPSIYTSYKFEVTRHPSSSINRSQHTIRCN